MSLTSTDDGATGRWEPNDWAVVLAGGQGRRLAQLTLNAAGLSVPKQFCSLGHRSSLVHEALLRAHAVAPSARTLLTVTQCHQAWWRDLREFLLPANLIVQPEQRGTGIGILHPLLEIVRRDPAASLAVLPSDHYFGNESGIADGLRTAMALTRKFPQQVLLLAFEPEDFDPDLGYVVPAAAQDGNVHAVSRFVEKPGLDQMHALIEQNALCNSFIFAASARALLDLFEKRYPGVVAQLQTFVSTPLDPAASREKLARLFHELPSIDFSEQIIGPEIGNCRVLHLPSCGWSDLGTPTRLDRVLRRHRATIDQAPVAPASMRGYVDLAGRSKAAHTSGFLRTTPCKGQAKLPLTA